MFGCMTGCVSSFRQLRTLASQKYGTFRVLHCSDINLSWWNVFVTSSLTVLSYASGGTLLSVLNTKNSEYGIIVGAVISFVVGAVTGKACSKNRSA